MNVQAVVTPYLTVKKSYKTVSGNKAAPDPVGGNRKIRNALNNVRKWLKKMDSISMRWLNE